VSEFPTGAPRLARRVVFTIELDAYGKIRKLDTVVATPKLSHVSFDFFSRAGPPDKSLLQRAGAVLRAFAAQRLAQWRSNH
jgi:hypothetical protein